MSDVYPPHIFGMHDRDGEHLMREKNKRGWVLVTEELGADPNNYSGSNYTDLTNQGLGVIVRLNYGYGSNGNIPHSSRYDNFARRCGNFVQASQGCHLWIIGNEMNMAAERPRPPAWPQEQVITPERYAACFLKCRREIRSRPGHEEDQVVVGAAAPWNPETTYPGNSRGDWVQYFADILDLLEDAVDGIAVHAYTHGQDPNLVFSDATMQPPFQNYHWHFRVYRDFLNAIPERLRDRPVYITETDQDVAWKDQNTGWVQNAFREIDAWNQDPNHQPIQALVLFRWHIMNDQDPKQVGWAIVNKPGVQDDFRAAMNNDYRVVLPHSKPEYRATWVEVSAPGRMDPGAEVQFVVKVRNDGRAAWPATGSQAVRLGYRWIDAGGGAAEGARTNLPRAVAPGGAITLPAVTVQAPDRPGFYTLELDLVQGASGWFAEQGSSPWRLENVQVGARYRVAWLNVPAPAQGTVGETVSFPVRVRNDGSLTWSSSGDHPVNLTYKWLNEDRQVVVSDGLRTSLGRDVAPLEEITLNARVQFPSTAGQYILQMDMVHEFVTWFQWKGSQVHESQVEARPAVPDYAAEWLRYDGPPRLVVGQVGSALVQVKNVGAQPWPRTGAEAIRLGYRWLDAQGQPVPAPGATTSPLTSAIAPGKTATFRDVELAAPAASGSYRLVWDLKQGDTWLSTQGVAVMELPFQVTLPEYGVAWQVLTPWPSQMPPGEELHTILRLHNTGSRTWTAGGDSPVHLAYHWFAEGGQIAEPWDTFRIRLPRDVPAGATVDLTDVAFKTPSALGNYSLRWDLVEEGRTWFFRQGAAPLEVPVEVSDQPILRPWTARASHNTGEAGLALDGDPNTFWDSKEAQTPGMWFQADLGEVLVLDRVKVASPGSGFPVGFKVKLSEDGQDWHLVAEKPQNWSDVDVAFAPCRARFVHLEQTGTPNWPATWKISEIAVSATGSWSGAKASHYTDDAAKALDARLRTYWNTRAVKQKPGMWFQVDMGRVREIERVALAHPTSQQPRGYVVQVSTEGQTWQEVGRQDDNWGQVDVRFLPVAARYVRVETTNSSPWHPWGIAEFVVWRSSPTWLRGREN